MNILAKPTRLTFDDFCAMVEDGQKADLIDGVVYMASPDNTDANLLNGWLLTILGVYVQRKNLGRVYVSRVAYRLDEHNGPEPDIGFVRQSRVNKVKRGFVDGHPDLALEIVSPDSIKRDYVQKRRKYERSGVHEYWIVDEIERKLTILRLGKDKRYHPVKPKDGVFQSKIIPGFWLREAWLWQTPLPDALDTLNMLLMT